MKRKKYVGLIIVLIFCLTVSANILSGCSLTQQKTYMTNRETEATQDIKANGNVFKYDISNYQYELEKFPSDAIMGPIANEQDAINKATTVLYDLFSEENVNNKKPYDAYFDNESETWLVVGSTPQLEPGIAWVGGTYFVIFRASDGAVLAAWGTK